MSGGNVIGSQKEMTAVINNLKESRVLDKAIDTLSLEESYSVKLLNLNTKMVNLQYGRLQNNVSKIKTNLAARDIATMKSLEMEGKFRCERLTASSSSKSKMAAAAKRLKFACPLRRTASAMPRLSNKYPSPAQKSSNTKQSNPKRHSITGDATDGIQVMCKKPRPQTSMDTDRSAPSRAESPSDKPARPSTALILERIATAQKSRKNLNRQTMYSCHDGSRTHGSGIAKDVFGPSPYEVRRNNYLGNERITTQSLAVRQNGFLNDTKKFVEINPCVYNMRPEMTEEVIHSIDSMAGRPGRWDNKKRISHTEVAFIRQLLLTDDRNKRDTLTRQLMEKWKNLHQGRNNSDTFVARQSRYK